MDESMEGFFDMKYCLFLCIIIIATGCSQHNEQSITVENLHKFLKPIESDVYTGYNQKLNTFYIGNRYVQRNMTLIS